MGKGDGGGGGAFLTQKGEKLTEVKREIAELEQLLAGTAQTSQATLLLKKRKEMKEVDDSLEIMKRDYKKRMDVCEEKRQQFEAKQAKMRESVLKFEKFIQENDSKRTRAEQKAKQERKLFEDKCRDVNLLERQKLQLEAQQIELQNELAHKSCYRDYLERVVEDEKVGSGYEEIGEILSRHKILVEANADLMKVSAQQDAYVDELRVELQSMKTRSQNRLLEKSGQLQAEQKKLEALRSTVNFEEEEKQNLEDRQKNMSRELSQISEAIRNLYSRCMTTMRNKQTTMLATKEHTSTKDLLEYNLEIIHFRLKDLIEIRKDYETYVNETAGVGAGTSVSGELLEASVSSTHTGMTTVGAPSTKASMR